MQKWLTHLFPCNWFDIVLHSVCKLQDSDSWACVSAAVLLLLVSCPIASSLPSNAELTRNMHQ